MHILDDMIDEIIHDIFTKMKGISKNDVIKFRYADELELRKARLLMLKADYTKEFENLNVLKSEVVKAIKGESSFSADMLSELISKSEEESKGFLIYTGMQKRKSMTQKPFSKICQTVLKN